jgi:hypothetical protein
MAKLEWKDGALSLPGGASIAVATRGPGATVAWRQGALELRAPALAHGGGAVDATVELVLVHPVRRPVHAWVPHLAPEPGQVIGDRVFRSPAVIVADGAIALAFVPDLDDADAAHGWSAWLDVDAPRSTVTLAAGAYRATGHVFFERQPLGARDEDVALRLHVLASERAEDRENPYGMAARWIWARWGRPRHARAAPAPFPAFMDHVARWAFSDAGWQDSVWQEAPLPGGGRVAAPVFIVDVSRHPSVPPARRAWREPPSLWNQAWFSTQRSANGLLRYARQTGSRDLEARARSMTEVALAAPETDGLFPAVLLGDPADTRRAWRWTNSDRRPPSASADACHLVDAAFTCRMLLEWHALAGEPRAALRARALAGRLVRLQRPSGAFPGWVEPDGRVPAELAEGPESAVATTLLLELGGEEPRFREAALRALPFLEMALREGRWEDFETYYSCAPWGAPEQVGRRVPRSGVFKQNTLSIFWTAEAFLAAWRATGDGRFLRLARRAADELSLYQAVHDPAFLPAPAHGGFGVMNADAEWNDARQSLFAPLYLELGRQTGDGELTERGISALRASFAMLYCPENAALARAYERRFPFFGPESHGFMMENQGHDPAQPIGTFTIFTWGNGSALATAAKVRDLFPELAREVGLS